MRCGDAALLPVCVCMCVCVCGGGGGGGGGGGRCMCACSTNKHIHNSLRNTHFLHTASDQKLDGGKAWE